MIDGKHAGEFPLVVWQTKAAALRATLNMNEVLANRASEILGGVRGEKRLVHPNDHVNRGQSSNDVFPAAMSLACTDAVRARVLPSVKALRDTLAEKSVAFADIVKIGRTHLMDATPLTLGQEISGWVAQLDHGLKHLESSVSHLAELALGGTAVGTGLNAHPEYAVRVAAKVAELTSHPIVTARRTSLKSLFAEWHDRHRVRRHGALKTLAASRIDEDRRNDVRWLKPRGHAVASAKSRSPRTNRAARSCLAKSIRLSRKR